MTTSTKTLLASLCAGAALTLAAPMALANEGKMDEKFAMMDANSDGKVSADEHEEFAEKHFKMMDKNGDGSLTKEEAKLAKEVMHKKS